MNKLVRRSILVALILLAGIQFVRPARTNPPVKQGSTLADTVTFPPEVRSIMERACIDCHSHRTRWPWYSNVAPASWFLIDHVNEGRTKMDMDNWIEETSFKDICKEVRSGGMPLPSYLILHPDAKLTQQEVQTVCAWTQTVSGR